MRIRNLNRQAIDEKLKPIQLFVERLTILIEDLINDSVFYCACVVVRISDYFYDDRLENRLVEIHLYGMPLVFDGVRFIEEIGSAVCYV